MASIFTKIANGEIPSFEVASDDHYYAFLDINPIVKGHTLVIPRKEVDRLFDLDNETYQGLFAFCKKVSKAIKATFPCNRVGLSVIGLEVPHAHVHLVPLNRMADIDFTRPKLQVDQEEMADIAERLRVAFHKQ